ncbi:hypothetical protein LJY25_03520 [Hymenobacter sp. BT175]|uniref:hypothetical protein n=1 Tax=Hymenobacter translucens TaxID=2886507 RepID=UPI001D0E7B6A|nr:hypothetical protein [Hymenobacter translucens]MCC2545500.1 hypothetical protein [Hymenobacter translucens]
MEPSHSVFEKEPLAALRVQVVRRTWIPLRPAFANVLFVLAFLSFAVFLFVTDDAVALRTFFVSGGFLLVGLVAVLLNALASAFAQRQVGEITFHRETFTLWLGEWEWILPNDQLVALKLNFSAPWNSPPALLDWGHSVTIVLDGQRVSFQLLDVPLDARQVLSSLKVASVSVSESLWTQPTRMFLGRGLKGLIDGLT